jgi:hypothetical protein
VGLSQSNGVDPEAEVSASTPEVPSRNRRLAPIRQALRLGSAVRPSADLVRIVAVWAAWLVIMCTFQVVVQARLQPSRPDVVLAWTQYATSQPALDCRSRLNDPFFNQHVKYDSEYYISIAVAGYDDPEVQAYYPDSRSGSSGIPVCRPGNETWVSLNYAFLPGYPTAMKGVMAIESVLPGTSDQTETGKAALAGIIVAALGGLLAMLALARLMAALARRRNPSPEDGDEASAGRWGGAGGLRAAFYLLVFPTGFYLAQVYTEGLFIGLAFMACALAVEKRILSAALLAVLATLVRPTGICLVLPLAWAVFEIVRDPDARARWRRTAVSLVAPLAPLVPFALWYFSSLGQNWRIVEDGFFGRSFDPVASLGMWGRVVDSFVSGVDKTAVGTYGYATFTGTPGPLPSSSTVYIGLELLALILAIAACVWLIRRMPGVALFGLAVVVMSAGSASAQGMDRYMIAVPAIFLMLAWLGRRPVFDRAWVLASTLLMGMLAMLYTFGFWVS